MNFRSKTTAGFSLVEITVASFITVLVVGITMACFIDLLKQHQLLQATADVSLEIQTATLKIYTAVVSSPSAPQLFLDTAATMPDPGTPIPSTTQFTYSGLCLRIALADHHYFMVTGGIDVLDQATQILGYNNTRTTVALSNTDPQASTHQLIINGASCPNAAVTTFSATIFNPGFFPNGFSVNPSSFFAINNVVTVPGTGFGGPTQLTVASVASSSIASVVSFTTALNASPGWGLPNGTLLTAPSPKMCRLTIITTASGKLRSGDLVLYPDDTDATSMATYTVLAHNIVWQKQNIRQDPSNLGAGTDEYPFTYNPTTQELIVNLQSLPPGNRIAGRATVGSRTRILLRTPVDQNNINNI